MDSQEGPVENIITHDLDEILPMRIAEKRRREETKDQLGGADQFIGIEDGQFRCAYSGRCCMRAMFVPGHKNVAFANLPCAFAWLDQFSLWPSTDVALLKQQLCDEYEVQLESVPTAPARDSLIEFGGDLRYDTWFEMLAPWDVHAYKLGTSVEQFRETEQAAGKRVVRQRKGRQVKLRFTAGQYLVKPGKTAASCRRVNVLDDAPVRARTDLTYAKAVRAVFGQPTSTAAATFCSDKGYLMVCNDSSTAEHNYIASKMGDKQIRGAALVTFTKKFMLTLYNLFFLVLQKQNIVKMSFHQGKLENSLPCYATKPQTWHTSRFAEYKVLPSQASYNLSDSIPFDRNWGRSDWLFRGFPHTGGDLMDDSDLPAPAPFAIRQMPTQYQYVKYADKLPISAVADASLHRGYSHTAPRSPPLAALPQGFY